MILLPTIAIYPRKSIYTGKGESVQTQVELCREYCDSHFETPSYLIYDEDEGYSGGNVKRPAFQRMMADARAHKFDVLCCYRLDRISRNVSDFSRTLEELQSHHIAFVSLREQFDTSTPMGRAMIYIASVFAQLERDTLAERVRDNVHRLARDGRWLGGNTPTGYTSKRMTFSRNGKEHSFMVLDELPEEMALVHTLYQKFIELGSLAKLETFCLKNNLKSKLGNDLERMAIRSILSNPVYCVADEPAYEFFSINEYNLCSAKESFDGIHGILPFNRTAKPSGSHTLVNDTSKWLISVGQHVGAIPGEKWVEAQMILEENKAKSRRKPRTNDALLSGLIKCGCCDSYMRPKVYGKPMEDGARRFSYICDMKERSKRSRCNMENAPGHDIDRVVIQRLFGMSEHLGSFQQQATSDTIRAKERVEAVQQSIDQLQASIAEKEERARNLVSTLSFGGSDATKARILQQIDELEASSATDKSRLSSLQEDARAKGNDMDVYAFMQSLLGAFRVSYDTVSQDERRRMLRNIIERIIWDGENIQIELFGEKRLPK